MIGERWAVADERVERGRVVAVWMVITVLAGSAAILARALDGHIGVGDTKTRLALLALVLFPTLGGHGLAIYLLRHVKSQWVALSVPAQFVLGTAAAALLWHERPSAWFCAGAAVVLSGVVLGVARSEQPSQTLPADANRACVDD